MAITKDQIYEQLRRVNDPELHRDIVTLNMVKQVAYCDGYATVGVELSQPTDETKHRLRQDIEEAVGALGDEIQQVAVEFSRKVSLTQQGESQSSQQQAGASQGQQQGGDPQQQARESNPLPDVKHIIAVGAGKGGVGKSTVAVNLAVGLARQGYRTGLLDGDIYGPSTPTMLGLGDAQAQARKNILIPFEVHGIKTMTIGKLVDEEKPLIWRGPMAHGAFKQLATQTDWGELDYLIIDLPPGTGDVPLTMSQLLPLTGGIVVCTPQKVAQDDARRAVRMFQQLGIPVLGIVENMSYFIGDDGREYDIFGRGGAETMSQRMGVPFLGRVPINTRLCASSDRGDPTSNFTGDDKLGTELETLISATVGQVNVTAMSEDAQAPSISVR